MNPTRVLLTHAEYKVLEVSLAMDWPFRLSLSWSPTKRDAALMQSGGSAGPSYLVRGKLNRVNPSLEARDGGADVPRDQATTAARPAHALADPGGVSPPAGTRRPGTPRDPGEGWRSLRPGLRHDREEVMP